MTKTEACRRVALAALLAGSMAAAQDASARTMNGIDLNGFADRSNALPDGGGPRGLSPNAGSGDKRKSSGVEYAEVKVGPGPT